MVGAASLYSGALYGQKYLPVGKWMNCVCNFYSECFGAFTPFKYISLSNRCFYMKFFYKKFCCKIFKEDHLVEVLLVFYDKIYENELLFEM